MLPSQETCAGEAGCEAPRCRVAMAHPQPPCLTVVDAEPDAADDHSSLLMLVWCSGQLGCATSKRNISAKLIARPQELHTLTRSLAPSLSTQTVATTSRSFAQNSVRSPHLRPHSLTNVRNSVIAQSAASTILVPSGARHRLARWLEQRLDGSTAAGSRPMSLEMIPLRECSIEKARR
jgi:hypothetical protein